MLLFSYLCVIFAETRVLENRPLVSFGIVFYLLLLIVIIRYYNDKLTIII